jgi:putative ABC transport system permease protein
MIRVALKGLLGRKLRAALTAFAIVLGVAMISGSLVLTDTVGKSFDGVYSQSYKASDAVVSTKDAISAGDGDAEAPAFSARTLARARNVPGVAAAEGSIEGEARLVKSNRRAIGAPGDGIAVGVDGSADQSLSPFKLADGRWPSRDGQIAIDAATAQDQHFAIGDTVGAFADGPVRRYTVTGLVHFGSEDTVAGSTITVFDLGTAQKLFDKQGKLDLIRLKAKPGVSDEQLVQRIAPLLPETAQVKTGSAQAKADSKDTQGEIASFKWFLLAFGGIALLVGSSVIANTLSITIAQRVRELATLRTLGASRRQVLRSVVLESLVVGLLGSAAGLFLGLGLAKGLFAILGATGVELPDQSLVFANRTILVSIGTGTLIALVASLRPAIRATRVQPIAAVREGAELPPPRFHRTATLRAVLTLAVAFGLLVYGTTASGLSTKALVATLGIGVLLFFRGVKMIAPKLIRPLASLLGAPGARVGGSAGALARQNAMRNPSRTASTAGALMIALSLITFVAVLGQGVKASFSGAVDELFVADYSVTAGDSPLTSKAAAAARKAPGVEIVSEIRTGSGKLNGKSVAVDGVDANLQQVVHMTWSAGEGNVPAQLGTTGAFVKKNYADDHDLTVGSPLTLKTPTGKILRLHLVAIFDEPKGGSPFGDVSISKQMFDRSFATHDNYFTLLNVEGDPSEATKTGIENALAAYPDAQVETAAQFKDGQIAQLNMAINIVYALLGLSVIVSLFGIVNTLLLSVFERTRELGMLRAIGMTRRQVRRMIRHESIVTALIGAALGIGVGMFLAVITTTALSKYGVVFAVPYATLVVFVGIAILAGMLAAILPARRASRLNILQALQYE